MSRLICLILKSGRALVASCASETTDHLAEVLRDGAALILTADDRVERVTANDVKEIGIIDARMQLPPSAAVYRFLNV